MELTGGCLCGAIRFEADEQPQWIRHCHCVMCRKVSGSAFLTGLIFRAGAIHWTGKPESYESSPGFLRTFCSKCGSSLTNEIVHVSDKLYLLLGSFDDPSKIKIDDNVDHVFSERELEWLHTDDQFPRSEGEKYPKKLVTG